MEQETSFLDYLIPYWPWLTLFIGWFGSYMRATYGIMNHRAIWYTSTLLFWFSVGVLIPDSWHESMWWMAPTVTTAFAAAVLSFHSLRDWLKRMQSNMNRRVARRRKR